MYASEASHLLLDKNRLAAATCSSVQCSCHITAVTFIYNCNFNGSVSPTTSIMSFLDNASVKATGSLKKSFITTRFEHYTITYMDFPHTVRTSLNKCKDTHFLSCKIALCKK